jgi:hypothetical protein
LTNQLQKSLLNFKHQEIQGTSSFFWLDPKESKSQGLQNTPAIIFSNRKCGRAISFIALRSFSVLLAIRFKFSCPVLIADRQIDLLFNFNRSREQENCKKLKSRPDVSERL